MNDTIRRIGRPGISYEDVNTVASAILAEGKKPTNAEVRMRLGTGSPAKICEFMQRWWSLQDDGSGSEQLTLSPSLLASISAEIKQHVAVTTADINAMQLAAEDDRNVLVREVSELTDRLSAANDRVSKQENDLSQMNGTLSGFNERLHAAAQREEQLTRDRDRTMQVLSDSRAELAGSIVRCEQLDLALARAQAEITELKVELNQARSATAAATERAMHEIANARRQADQHIEYLFAWQAQSSTPSSTDNFVEPESESEVNLESPPDPTAQQEQQQLSGLAHLSLKDKILAVAEEMMGSRPTPLEAFRDELVNRGISIPGAGKLANLSVLISRSKRFRYDRSLGGWALIRDNVVQEQK